MQLIQISYIENLIINSLCKYRNDINALYNIDNNTIIRIIDIEHIINELYNIDNIYNINTLLFVINELLNKLSLYSLLLIYDNNIMIKGINYETFIINNTIDVENDVINNINTIMNTITTIDSERNGINTIRAAINILRVEKNKVRAAHNAISTLRVERNILRVERNIVGSARNAIITLRDRNIVGSVRPENMFNNKKYNIVHTITEVVCAVELTIKHVEFVIKFAEDYRFNRCPLFIPIKYIDEAIKIIELTKSRIVNANNIAKMIINCYGSNRIQKNLMKDGITSIELCLFDALKCIKIIREIYTTLSDIKSFDVGI